MAMASDEREPKQNGPQARGETKMSYEARKTNELFDKFEAQLHGRYRAMYTRHNVFLRVADLKAEGYVEDVAFAKALIEYGFEV